MVAEAHEVAAVPPRQVRVELAAPHHRQLALLPDWILTPSDFRAARPRRPQQQALAEVDVAVQAVAPVPDVAAAVVDKVALRLEVLRQPLQAAC